MQQDYRNSTLCSCFHNMQADPIRFDMTMFEFHELYDVSGHTKRDCIGKRIVSFYSGFFNGQTLTGTLYTARNIAP